MPAMLDADDDLLPRITALGKTDRMIEVGFIHHCRTVDIYAVTRNAGFDPEYLDRIITDLYRTGVDQCLSQVSYVRNFDEQVETLFGRVRVANDRHWSAFKFSQGDVAWVPGQ